MGSAVTANSLSSTVFTSADQVVVERRIEEMEEYGKSETDMLGVPRQVSPISHLSSSSSSSSASVWNKAFIRKHRRRLDSV
jgi:hypothetical protein